MSIKLGSSRYDSFWVIAYPPSTHSRRGEHYADSYSASSNRARCIEKFLHMQKTTWSDRRPEGTRTWQQWYARGYRCVRVRMVLA